MAEDVGISRGALIVGAVVVLLAVGQTDANNRVADAGRKATSGLDTVGVQLGSHLGSNGGTSSPTHDQTGALDPSNVYVDPTWVPADATFAPVPTAPADQWAADVSTLNAPTSVAP